MNESVYYSKNEPLYLYEVPFVVAECLECVNDLFRTSLKESSNNINLLVLFWSCLGFVNITHINTVCVVQALLMYKPKSVYTITLWGLVFFMGTNSESPYHKSLKEQKCCQFSIKHNSLTHQELLPAVKNNASVNSYFAFISITYFPLLKLAR